MQNVVAEISIHRVSDGWYAWSVYNPTIGAQERMGHGPSPTEALWAGVDVVRAVDDRARGRIAVHSFDDSRVAYPPLWVVPRYELLVWHRNAQEVEVR